jgi:TonB family protein
VASGLDPAKTQALVRSHLPEIQRCYERGKMDDPEIKGRVTLRISVSTSGAVTSAVVETSSLRSSAVESCVVSAVRGWTFPAPVGGPAVISYPFNLH